MDTVSGAGNRATEGSGADAQCHAAKSASNHLILHVDMLADIRCAHDRPVRLDQHTCLGVPPCRASLHEVCVVGRHSPGSAAHPQVAASNPFDCPTRLWSHFQATVPPLDP